MGGQGTFVGFFALERMHMGGQGAFVGFFGFLFGFEYISCFGG